MLQANVNEVTALEARYAHVCVCVGLVYEVLGMDMSDMFLWWLKLDGSCGWCCEVVLFDLMVGFNLTYICLPISISGFCEGL